MECYERAPVCMLDILFPYGIFYADKIGNK